MPRTEWLRWLPGRQGTGYRKLLLASGSTWDLWLLDYPPGTVLPRHLDVVKGREHHRVNVVLWGSPRAFYAFAFVKQWLGGRITSFRPDLVSHEVRASSGRRVVVSLGWTRAPR